MNRHKLLFMLLILGLGLCSGLFAQVNITIGDGTTTNTTTGAPSPYGTYFKNFRQQYLYTAADIENAGGGAGPINSLAFNVQAVNTCSPMPNFSIKIKQTEQSVLTTTFEVGEYTEVFFENDFLPVDGMNVHTFIAPFTWDGSSNILVDIVTTMIPETYTQNASVYYTATTGVNTALRYHNDTLPAADATTGTLSVNRANVTFNMTAVQIVDPPNPANLVSPADGSTLSTMATTLNWGSGGGLPTGYKLHMGTTNPPAFVEDLGSVTSYSTPNLEFSTTYYWQIVPYNANGDADNCPVWSFVSMPNPIVSTFPWTVDFGTETTEPFPPTHWTRLGGQYPNASGTSTLWLRGNYLNGPVGNNAAKMNIYGTSRYAWFITPPIDIPADGYELKFDLGLTRYNNPSAILDPTSQLDDKFIVVMSDSPDMSNPTILREYNNAGSEFVYNEIPHTGINAGITLDGISGIKYFAFYGESTVSGGDNDLFIDNVTVREIPATSILAVSPTEWNFGQIIINTTATNSFTITNDGGGTLNVGSVVVSGQYFGLEEPFSALELGAGETATFSVQYMPLVAGEHTGTATVTAGTQEVTISLSGSSYDPIISTFPWTEDFGTTAADPFAPVEWSQRNGFYPTPTGTTAQWIRGTWLHGEAGNNAAKINIYGTTRNGWLVTPPINIPAAGFNLSFDLGLTDWNNPDPIENPEGQEDDRFMVLMSSNPDMTDPVILREWNNSGSEFVFNAIPVTGTSVNIPLTDISGMVFFAFYGESTVSNGDNDLFVDNVSVFEGTTPENPIFSISPASHDFGDVNLGETVSQTFTITNIGGGTLSISSIAMNSAMMSVPNPGLPFNLGAGQSASLVVYYAPTAVGDHSTVMVITDNTSRVAHNINLYGNGVQTATDLYPPTNLQAAIQANDVHLSWNAPEPPPTGEWITWCDPADLGNGIGTNAAATFDVAHRYEASDLLNFQGSTLTHVQFVANEVLSTYTVKIWTGGTATTPGSMVHSQLVNAPVIGSWNTVELTTPIPVPATGQLWIGIGIVAQAGYPAGCDDGPQVEGKGNMMNFGGWTTLSQVNAALTYNWSIQGYVDHEFRALAFMPEAIVETPAITLTEGTLAKSGTNRTITREHTGYKVYRDGALVGTVTDIETLTYVDSALELGSYDYHVTAAYTAGESLPTNTVSVTIEDLAPPADLAATVDGNDVNLTWTSPVPPLEGEWISWSNNDLIDNSIGTDGVANFDVAHRYDANDILPHVGGTLAMVKFTPMFANAVYTVKIWTGGTTTAPGTLVHSQVVSNPTIQDWTTVILTNPVLITGDQLWFGYNVNTQGGFPAGCDTGPQVEGKGNMMYINNAWTTLSQVSATLTYNWQLQGLVVQGGTYKAIAHTPIVESPLPRTTGNLKNSRIAAAKNNSRAILLGYKVYRDGAMISSINDPAVTTFTDNSMPNADYVYGISAVYNNGESAAATVEVTVNLELAPVVFEDSFETYDDFAMAMAPWTLLDQDGSATYGFDGITFPNSESAMAYIVFNPSATVPPLTGMDPYEGNKMAASFAAVTPPNSDWMITPRINLGANSSLRFYAKSHTAQYGLERFRVGVSTAPAIYPQLFTYITGTSHVEAPINWTEYHYDLSAYDNQSAFIGIRCVSDDAFVFYVDNVSVHSGASSTDDNSAPVVKTELKGNYPNPFNPETTIRYSVKENSAVTIEVYNLKGQLVKRLVNSDKAAGEHSVVWNGTDSNNRPVSSGVYFYRMNTGKFSSSKKMIMMK